MTRVKKSVGKAGAKRVAKKPVVKSATKKAAKKVNNTRAKETVTEKITRAKRVAREDGFTPGSDLELAFLLMLEGGDDRRDVMHKVQERFKDENRSTANGNAKPVSTIMNQVMRRALGELGYVVQSSWKLVPAEEASNEAAEQVAVEIAEVAANEPAVRRVKKVAKKTGKKRVTRK